MKLSLWMIARRLHNYVHMVDIKRGEPQITGIRFFSGGLNENSLEFVYLGRASDAFDDEKFQKMILLVNDHDSILLNSHDMENILNEILSTFDYYNSWEKKLLSIGPSDDIQLFADHSADVMKNPFRVAGAYGEIVVISKEFGDHYIDGRWRTAWETRNLHIKSGGPMMTANGEKVLQFSPSPKEYIFTDSGKKYIAAQIEVDMEAVATFMMWEYENEFTPCDLQLSEVLCGILAKRIAGGVSNLMVQTQASIFNNLLGGGEVDSDYLNKRIPSEGSPWQILVIRNYTGNMNALVTNRLHKAIAQSEVAVLCAVYAGQVVAIVSEQDMKRFAADTRGAIFEQFTFGVSYPFADLENVPLHFGQAVFALEKSEGKPGVFYCKDFVFEHLLAHLKEYHISVHFCHPALSLLSDYDRNQKTSLYDTLYQFILNERNLVATAEALFIHRNTLVFRMKRIASVVDTDLDDPMERLHILLSYLVRRESSQIP